MHMALTAAEEDMHHFGQNSRPCQSVRHEARQCVGVLVTPVLTMRRTLEMTRMTGADAGGGSIEFAGKYSLGDVLCRFSVAWVGG